MKADANSQGASKELKLRDHHESTEHDSKPQAASESRSCEDLFGEFQGQLIFWKIRMLRLLANDGRVMTVLDTSASLFWALDRRLTLALAAFRFRQI